MTIVKGDEVNENVIKPCIAFPLTLRLFHVVRKDVLETKARCSAAWTWENTCDTYVGPCHKVVGRFAKVANSWVVHNLVRNVKVVGVLDERPAWLAATDARGLDVAITMIK